MSCGTPVIYGNRGALPEIVQNGGLPADPESLGDIRARMTDMILNPSLRRRLAERALARSRMFSWEQTARRTLEAYKQSVSV
jgi:glycosyltransferase involved in cell wall biosynthesis